MIILSYINSINSKFEWKPVTSRLALKNWLESYSSIIIKSYRSWWQITSNSLWWRILRVLQEKIPVDRILTFHTQQFIAESDLEGKCIMASKMLCSVPCCPLKDQTGWKHQWQILHHWWWSCHHPDLFYPHW